MRRNLVAVTAALVALVPSMAAWSSVTAQSTPAPTTRPTIAFVVDTSGSMAGSRLTQAKAALQTGIDALADGQAAGLRSFAGACSSRGTVRVPVDTNNRDQLRTQTANLFASGLTPTPGALLGAADELRDVDGPKVVLLISDGQSSCGDPCPTAQAIKDDLGVDFAAVTVGFQAPTSAESELRCIADVTGGQYFSADDEEGLAAAIGAAVVGGSAEYVAVGDSTTTGFSVPTCSEDRAASKVGCLGDPPAPPYPERIAAADERFDSLDRVGIWGYTIVDAVDAYNNGQNVEGDWTPQLTAAQSATGLVTVSLGANDMEFSDIEFWLKNCVGVRFNTFFGRVYDVDFVAREGACRDAAQEKVSDPDLVAALDDMFDALDVAADNGAEVVVTLYFNPYNHSKHVSFLPDRSCRLIHDIGDIVTDTINAELQSRADAAGFTVVDFKPAFDGHGSGAKDPYVFGSDCEVVGALTAADVDFDFGWPPVSLDTGDSETEIKKRFDPHPNAAGTAVQAQTILEAL
jgi:Mg-chelatase subunit ChlD